MKSIENILERVVNKIILKRYPEVESIGEIKPLHVGDNRTLYSLGLIMKEHISPELQDKIYHDVKSLFTMSSLDTYDDRINSIMTLFDFKDGGGYRYRDYTSED
jgi:hypothetical protein